jgi:hypothetical protein
MPLDYKKKIRVHVCVKLESITVFVFTYTLHYRNERVSRTTPGVPLMVAASEWKGEAVRGGHEFGGQDTPTVDLERLKLIETGARVAMMRGVS